MADPSSTRERLIDATIDALAERGEPGVRMQQIAAAAGVTEPAIYHFFKNRDGLIESAQAERFLRDQRWVVEHLVSLTDSATTADEFFTVIEQILRSMYQPDRREFRLVRMSIVGNSQFRPDGQRLLAAAQAELVAAVGGVFQRAQDRGWARDDLDPFAVASWVIGQINGRVLAELDPDPDRLALWDTVSVTAVMAVLRL